MYSGYWQVLTGNKAPEIMEFFTPDGKQQCKVMPIGDLNAAPSFVGIIMKLKMEWETLAKERSLKCFNQKSLLIMCYCMGPQQRSSYHTSEPSWMS